MKLRKVGHVRHLCFDLENRPLAYWFDGQTTSQITAFGWKWSDEPEPHTLLLHADGRFENDTGKKIGNKAAHARFREVLCSASLVFGHNIRRHDLPIFQAWLLRHELPPLPRLLTSDTLRDYPKRRDMSASLENLAAMYDLEGVKFGMSQPMWEQANKLTPDGIALVRKRVSSDVILQQKLRAKLMDLGLLGEPRYWSP